MIAVVRKVVYGMNYEREEQLRLYYIHTHMLGLAGYNCKDAGINLICLII